MVVGRYGTLHVSYLAWLPGNYSSDRGSEQTFVAEHVSSKKARDGVVVCKPASNTERATCWTTRWRLLMLL